MFTLNCIQDENKKGIARECTDSHRATQVPEHTLLRKSQMFKHTKENNMENDNNTDSRDKNHDNNMVRI